MSFRQPKTQDMKLMGSRLRRIREAKGLTQPALADIMGVTTSAVSAWENGRNIVDAVALGAAAKYLGFTTDYVILGEIGGLPFDLAREVQRRERAELGATGAQRGRPKGRPSVPAVRDIPDTAAPPHRPRGATVHEPDERYIPPPKTRDV